MSISVKISMTTFLQVPSMLRSTFSRFMPSSSVITCIKRGQYSSIVNMVHKNDKLRHKCTTSPPVRAARSCRLAFLFSPNPGALMAQTCREETISLKAKKIIPQNQETVIKASVAQTLIPARSLLRIRVARASLSTSSETINSGLCLCMRANGETTLDAFHTAFS